MPWEIEHARALASSKTPKKRSINENGVDDSANTIVPYATNLALPLNIEIEASNGASDYGNKYGEPVVSGFTRSFGQRLPNGERVEWIKPIMFTAGVIILTSNNRFCYIEIYMNVLDWPA
jgi:phosphoribosylformylglycinamidine (FGAM) synthase-like enzyme